MCVFNRKEPELIYTSFEHYLIKRFSSYCLKKNPFPCLYCSGNGTIYDPDDPRCPIEGNKCRRRIKCQRCGGSGAGNRKEILDEYNEWLKDYKKRHKQWASDMKKWNKIQDWIDKHPKLEVRGILGGYGIYR